MYHNEVILGGCIQVMKNIEDKSIDMILCDLPYAVTHKQKWDTLIPFDDLWDAYKRIIKDNGAIVLTAVEPFRSKLICSNSEMFRYDLIWKKNKSFGFLNAKKQPLRIHESVLVFYKKQPCYNPQKTTGHKPVNSYTKRSSDGDNYGKTKLLFSGGGQTDRYPTSIMSFPVVNNDSDNKLHPAQKPIELMDYLIKTYTNEGDIVLDNCAGSGTTLLAARKINRNFIGIESDLCYYNSCRERLGI
jgi:DNA modification methylase